MLIGRGDACEKNKNEFKIDLCDYNHDVDLC